jgi:K+-transporting ATPase c subunit
MTSHSVPSIDTSSTTTLIGTTTLSGASTTISNLNLTGYKSLIFQIYGLTNATSNGQFQMKFNNSTTIFSGSRLDAAVNSNMAGTFIFTNSNWTANNALNVLKVQVDFVNDTASGWNPIIINGVYNSTNGLMISGALYPTAGTPISSVVFSNSGGSWTAGTVKVYGVK